VCLPRASAKALAMPPGAMMPHRMVGASAGCGVRGSGSLMWATLGPRELGFEVDCSVVAAFSSHSGGDRVAHPGHLAVETQHLVCLGLDAPLPGQPLRRL